MLCAAFIFQVSLAAASACSEPSCVDAVSTPALVQRDHSRWRYQHPDLEDAPVEHGAMSCEGRSLRSCGDHVLCAWSRHFSRCQARIAWFHVMKCGTSLGTTLPHFANSSLPEMAHIPSCSGTVADPVEDACPHKSDDPSITKGGEFFGWKYPIEEWFPEVFWTYPDPSSHRPILEEDDQMWKGRFVGLFRDPTARVASAYNDFVARDPALANNSAEGLQTFSALARGAVTQMLSGVFHANPIWCEFHFHQWLSQDNQCQSEACTRCVNELPSPEALDLAMERLHHFAFVGLTDFFDLSVCLFHHMFGGQCHPVEFTNMRQDTYKANYSAMLESHGYNDPYDGKIFGKASNIFWSNVAKYNVTPESCRQMCPNSNATFDF
eukprot:Skav200018  [mRNA]  locus=scaffold2535:90566:91705:+ [translate_table: standard]